MSRVKVPVVQRVTRFKKKHVVLPRRKALLAHLRRKLVDKKFLSSFLRLRDGNIFVYTFDGVKVVIKYTGSRKTDQKQHGIQYKKIRQTILEHQRAARNGLIETKNYVIRTPKVYGRIGRHLVMEFVEGVDVKYTRDALLWNKEVSKAYDEAEANFVKLVEKNKIKESEIPQVPHLIYLGKVKKPGKKAKCVFSLPYDYF